ncbi:MAG TPA: hemerythrin domain-containing protein [Gammaproteobacteria bacterium]|jgi:hemerythrin-like domain-containing protein|nr:hemerythrin domain-containing protein [Gammaproteobacteria bacterium]
MPVNPINALRQEHGNMRSVLVVVRDQLAILERGSVPDFVLLANAMHYMRRFPGLVHHPKEDFIFARLMARAPDMREAVEHARREHREIYEQEEWIIECALNAPKPGTTARGRLLDIGRAYLESQRKHSEREEHVLFPRAEQALTAADWEDVERQFGMVDDPLFGRNPGERYELLYEHLMQQT